MLGKLRPNVLILVAIGAGLAAYLGTQFGHINEVVIIIASMGMGSVFTLAGQVATEPPPPTVPADVHLALMQHERDHKH